jgi:hypothetical protein
MGEAEHPVVVPVLPGKQACAGGGARWSGAECLAKQNALVGQALDVRRRHLMAVRLHEATRVVRVQVEDVGKGGGHQRSVRRHSLTLFS